MKRRYRRRTGRSNLSRCHLCGLPIPIEIVSSTHPLFGTVDHIIPISRNGPEAPFNRAPSHRLCNEKKADRIIDPEQFAAERQSEIGPLLEAVGRRITPGKKHAAILWVVQEWPIWALCYSKEMGGLSLRRWEDDGGRHLFEWWSTQ